MKWGFGESGKKREAKRKRTNRVHRTVVVSKQTSKCEAIACTGIRHIHGKSFAMTPNE